MTANIQLIEKRSLGPARWANLFMGAAGITAALLSNASALMLDGLFSGVNFVAAVVAAKVAQSVSRKPDVLRPFGYEIDEAVYVMFRSLVLTGIIIVAAFNAGNKIFIYVAGGDVAPVKLGWVVGYMVLMITICFSLAAWHHRNWLATGRQSELLKTERTGAVIDGVLSAAAGAAFLLIALLKNTPLAFLVPISDAIVVLGLATYMIWQPLGMFGRALREVVGEAANEETQQRLRAALKGGLNSREFLLLDSAVTRLGRSLFAVAYIQPNQPIDAARLDEIRDQLLEQCRKAFDVTPLRMEVIFTARRPFDAEAARGSSEPTSQV
jgi:predicted Co/Zn/Cd cation transporter (cation efflux family)